MYSGYGDMGQQLVAERAGHGDLLAGRQVARPRNLPGIDGVADHHVEPRFGGGGADAGGEAVIEIDLGDAGVPENMLLGRHQLDALQGQRVVPAEMGVRLGHPRHQGGAAAIDDGRAGDLCRLAATGDPRDAVALDQDFAR